MESIPDLNQGRIRQAFPVLVFAVSAVSSVYKISSIRNELDTEDTVDTANASKWGPASWVMTRPMALAISIAGPFGPEEKRANCRDVF